jgi:glycosyltransferase involved in cell wall biosynthesis
MKICVLFPAYNEEKTIAGLVRDVKKHASGVIVVDDGSSDKTSDEAASAGAHVIINEKNMGKGASLKKGFEYVSSSGYEAVITMDADRQHDFREIPFFIKKMEETGADIVLGTRMGNHKGMPVIRMFTNFTTSLIVSILSGSRVTDSQTGFRLIKTRVLKEVELETSNYETESEMLIKAGRKNFAIEEIPIKTIYAGQESEIKPCRDTVRFIRLVLKFLIKKDG